jgi:DNA-binding PadR family transcriptional regulator
MEPQIYITKDMRRMILKIFLLKKISKERTYAYSILKDIMRMMRRSHHKLDFGLGIKNELYNTINTLQNAGYIKMEVEVEGNRIKKYYTITPLGRRVLKDANVIFKRTVRQLQGLLPR